MRSPETLSSDPDFRRESSLEPAPSIHQAQSEVKAVGLISALLPPTQDSRKGKQLAERKKKKKHKAFFTLKYNFPSNETQSTEARSPTYRCNP